MKRKALNENKNMPTILLQNRDVQFKTSMDYQNYINDSNSFNPVCFGKTIWKKNLKITHGRFLEIV